MSPFWQSFCIQNVSLISLTFPFLFRKNVLMPPFSLCENGGISTFLLRKSEISSQVKCVLITINLDFI